jgi:toxin ParE1/3/4
VIVEWRPEAESDRDALVAYVERDNPFAARQILYELILAADSLAEFPQRGRLGLVAGTRELVMNKPYVLVYEFDLSANRVLIRRIWHMAQDR